MKKISIITITLNSAAYLEQTIDSVARQNYPNIEYIVVDGGSTDRTIDIIKKHEAQIDKWISEPDHGIADAMNKGLAMASGDYILFLHSDDYLVGESAISNASQHLTHGKDIVFCSIYLEKNGTQRPHRPRGFNWWMNFKSGVYHQSAICARSLFFKIGPFDKGFRIAMDYDFFLRAYLAGASSLAIDLPLASMRLVGISSKSDWVSLRERFQEERRVHSKNCRSAWMRLVYRGYWAVYLPYRKLRSLCCCGRR